MWSLESIGETPQLDIGHRHLATKQSTSPLDPPLTKVTIGQFTVDVCRLDTLYSVRSIVLALSPASA